MPGRHVRPIDPTREDEMFGCVEITGIRNPHLLGQFEDIAYLFVMHLVDLRDNFIALLAVQVG